MKLIIMLGLCLVSAFAQNRDLTAVIGAGGTTRVNLAEISSGGYYLALGRFGPDSPWQVAPAAPKYATVILETGLCVLVDNVAATIIFASNNQINFIAPDLPVRDMYTIRIAEKCGGRSTDRILGRRVALEGYGGTPEIVTNSREEEPVGRRNRALVFDTSGKIAGTPDNPVSSGAFIDVITMGLGGDEVSSVEVSMTPMTANPGQVRQVVPIVKNTDGTQRLRVLVPPTAGAPTMEVLVTYRGRGDVRESYSAFINTR